MISWKQTLAVTVGLAAQADAAQFDFATLIRFGAPGGAAATNWELAIGNTAGTWSATGNATPHFNSTSSRRFEIGYTKSTNTANVTLFDGTAATGTTDSASFNPTGGGAVAANAIWTLPAASFFAQAAAAPGGSLVQVSNLALTAGSVIAPVQSTAMTRLQSGGSGAGTITHGGDVVFVADASGNWRLQGIVTMIFVGAASANGLTFGLSANASDVPEPMSSVLIGLGLIGLALAPRFRRR